MCFHGLTEGILKVIVAVIMYFRRSSRRYKDRTYYSYQLVSTHRHPETRRPTTKVHASLGDLSKIKEEDRTALVVSLARALGVMKLMGFTDEELEALKVSAEHVRENCTKVAAPV